MMTHNEGKELDAHMNNSNREKIGERERETNMKGKGGSHGPRGQERGGVSDDLGTREGRASLRPATPHPMAPHLEAVEVRPT